jgi:hypothetical protein
MGKKVETGKMQISRVGIFSKKIQNEILMLKLIKESKIHNHKIPLHPPLPKGELKYPPLWKRGVRGDFVINKFNKV